MILKGKPNLTVQKIVRRRGKRKVIVDFMFDDQGFAEIDETTRSPQRIALLSKTFEVVDNMSTHKVDNKVKYSEMKMKELREIAKEKGVKFDATTRKVELIKLLKTEV